MKSQFTIKSFLNPSGATAYRVQGMKDGKFIRQNFKTEGEAMTVKQNLEREVMNLAPLPAITTRLTSDQSAEAESCYRRLTGHALTLSQVVDFALKNYRVADKVITVRHAYSKFYDEKSTGNLRPATLRTFKVRLMRLVTTFPDTNLHELLPDAIRPLIFRRDSGNVNRESDYRVFSNFFNWCVSREFLTVSPMAKIQRIKLDRLEPKIFTLAECQRLVNAAATFREGVMLPYVVLGLFCAIRPTEIARLGWPKIDLDAATVTIGSDIAKCRGRRVVKLSSNAVTLLAPFIVSKPELCGANFRRHFDALKAVAGLSDWTMDILRHTAISMHLARHEHEGQTATWAGNSPTIIQQHYKGLVKPADAQAFWDIVPSQAEIINLNQKAA